jgi:hypothetical protein
MKSSLSAIAILLLLSFVASASAVVFQYAAPIATAKGERMAYLWIPPQAKQVRGVVVGGMSLMEREFAQDARIRQACADQQLAIVFLKCGLSAVDIQEVLDRFAKSSGYRELSVAPLMFIGHSAGGPQARHAAREFGDRCFGVVQYRGADPGDVDHDGADAVGPGVPALLMIGQFDEFGKIGRNADGVENWEKDRDKLVAFRGKDDRHLASIVVEPGGGHFAWSDRNAEYLALFLRKAAQRKIPTRWSIDASEPVALNALPPQDGWLTDPAVKTPGRFAPAPYSRYEGDRKFAAWHFDEEMAKVTIAYHNGIAKQDQFLEWNDPHTVNAGARNYFDTIHWIGDGRTFRVHPQYSSKYPRQSNGQGSRWGKAGEPVGHAPVAIQVKHVSGPIVHAGDHTFRIRFDELSPAAEPGRITFMAYSEGDDTYRYTERVGMIAECTLKAGKAQTITFPPVGDLTIGSEPVELKAESDSGLPVEFHVAFGPAKISDGKLTIAELPQRAKYPLTIKVVAWQAGSGVDPLVQTAVPVEQTIHLREE